MADDEQRPPDSLSGKLRELIGSDDEDDAAAGNPALRRDTGPHEPTHAGDEPPAPPRRPTDPPF